MQYRSLDYEGIVVSGFRCFAFLIRHSGPVFFQGISNKAVESGSIRMEIERMSANRNEGRTTSGTSILNLVPSIAQISLYERRLNGVMAMVVIRNGNKRTG